MADISKITIPSGSEYDLKDAGARQDITDLSNSLPTVIPQNSFNLRGTLEDATDLNDISDFGIYRISDETSGGTMTNLPEYASPAGILIVIPGADTSPIRQIFMSYDENHIFSRIRTYGNPVTWGNWFALPAVKRPGIVERINIPVNTDLNSVSDPGYYYSPSSADAQTLSNCPVTTAFTMLVMHKSGSYRTQIIWGSSAMYMRTQSSSGWGTWYTITNINNLTRHKSDTSTSISDLSTIQEHTTGVCKLAKAVSPTNAALTGVYECIGAGSYRALKFYRVSDNTAYVNTYDGSSWKGWKTITLS